MTKDEESLSMTRGHRGKGITKTMDFNVAAVKDRHQDSSEKRGS